MLKRNFIFASLFALTLSLEANTINAVAAIVDNEPITTVEIAQTSKRLGVSEGEALNALIKDRLEQAQIKALGIIVTPFEVNARIDEIAKQNNTTPASMRASMMQKGMSFAEFTNNVKQSMLQERLYQSILANARGVNETKARAYYEANQSLFTTFESAKITTISSTDGRALEAKIADPLRQIEGVSVKEENVKASNLKPEMLNLIAKTDIGSYTPIMRTPNGFEAILVQAKTGNSTMPFENVKEALMQQMFNAEQNKVMADYFEKLRAKAKIKILR